MEDLLFLVHRIPYPPNKGDKIRSFQLLRFLSSRYRVHLVCFVDDPVDWPQREALKPYCVSSYYARLDRRWATLRSLKGLLTGEALTLPYYRQSDVVRCLDSVRRQHDIRRVLVYSSSMAPYVMGAEWVQARRVIDFVDVDSDKWRQYAKSRRFPMSWVYRREAARLEGFEKAVARSFDASVFVSEPEAELFRRLLRDDRLQVMAVNNGVDTDYFSPQPERASPFTGKGCRLVFTGAMDYWANIEAVSWFAREVFARVREERPEAEFYIVGMHPAEQVCDLARQPGITVTGAVPDVRPYLQHAQAVVAPLRIARGIQNKVLEAMAMARPVVATPQAMEGIPAQPDRQVFVAENTQDFAIQVLQAIGPAGAQRGEAARRFVCEQFGWNSSLPRLIELLERD